MTKKKGLIRQNALVVTLGWIATLAGIYLYFNWTDVFTQLRGMVSVYYFSLLTYDLGFNPFR